MRGLGHFLYLRETIAMQFIFFFAQDDTRMSHSRQMAVE